MFTRGHLIMRIVLAALACAVGLALYFGSRPVFYGRSLVRLGEPADAVRTRALAKELMQPQLIERTARRLGTQATATELSGTRLFSVEAQPVGAREIEVKVRAFSRAWAEQWGAAMVAEYADFQRVRRRKEAVDFVRGLNRELTEIAEKLGDSEAKRFAATDKAGLALELAEINELRNPARVLGPLVKRIAVLGEVRAQLQNPETPIVEKLSLLAAMEHANGDENAEAASGWESLEVRRRPLLALPRRWILPGSRRRRWRWRSAMKSRNSTENCRRSSTRIFTVSMSIIEISWIRKRRWKRRMRSRRRRQRVR